ncbi:MAG TPA: hypothetical protein VF407_20710 [Polyangiaceae bacterium]
MRACFVSVVAVSAAVGFVAACSGSDDTSSPGAVDGGIDASGAPSCPATLTVGEQIRDDRYAAGSCTTEGDVCSLSETLCVGHPATFICDCEDGEWTCAISSGTFDECVTNEGGTFDSSFPDDDAIAPLPDASTDDDADTADAADAADD